MVTWLDNICLHTRKMIQESFKGAKKKKMKSHNPLMFSIMMRCMKKKIIIISKCRIIAKTLFLVLK